MRTGNRNRLAALALAACCCLPGPSGEARAGEARPNRVVQIGIVKTVFRDTPSSLINVLSKPLRVLMEAQTGMTGELQLAADAETLARQLKENKVQLGVFHGVEFAWARRVNPDLKPLVISLSPHRVLHAHVVVQKDGSVQNVADLKGKAVALPRMSKEHLHLYLERRCPGTCSPKEFFTQVTSPSDAEDALDDVVDGAVQAALVDRAGLDKFQESKPARANKLRVLHQSEAFPASVIAYQDGALDEATIRRFRDGLIDANKSSRGRDLLKLCRIVGFEAIPADYEQLLDAIGRAYPPPGKDK